MKIKSLLPILLLHGSILMSSCTSVHEFFFGDVPIKPIVFAQYASKSKKEAIYEANALALKRLEKKGCNAARAQLTTYYRVTGGGYIGIAEYRISPKHCHISSKTDLEGDLLTKSTSSEKLQGAEIPHTAKQLFKMKNADKDSYAYQNIAHKAAMDMVHEGKEALRGQNSSRALKLLSIGAKLLPWRGDVVALRDAALNTNINIVNDMLTTADISCEIITERVEYLSTYAPDSIMKIKGYKSKCATSLPTNKSVAKTKVIDQFKKRSPKQYLTLEKKHYQSPSKQLDYIINRNKTFPLQDILILGFQRIWNIQ